MGTTKALLSLAMLFIVLTTAGCVDLLTSHEVLTEASWYGRVTDVSDNGVPNVTVVLHVLNDHGEIYSRSVQAAAPEPVKGIYAFEHIELRDGADRAYTTCNATIDGKPVTATGEMRYFTGNTTTSAIDVKGKTITVITYGGVVDERLKLK